MGALHVGVIYLVFELHQAAPHANLLQEHDADSQTTYKMHD